jgi:hypothetical protein
VAPAGYGLQAVRFFPPSCNAMTYEYEYCEHCHNDGSPCPVCSAHRRFHDSLEERSEHYARYIENQKRGRLTASQLADQLNVDGMTARVINLCAKIGVVPCIWLAGEAYFYPDQAEKSLKRLRLVACKHDDLDAFGRCRDCRLYNVLDDPDSEHERLKRWQARQAG